MIQLYTQLAESTNHTLAVELHGAFDLRQRSDYGADQTVSGGDAQKMLDNAILFVSKISSLLKDQPDPAI